MNWYCCCILIQFNWLYEQAAKNGLSAWHDPFKSVYMLKQQTRDQVQRSKHWMSYNMSMCCEKNYRYTLSQSSEWNISLCKISTSMSMQSTDCYKNLPISKCKINTRNGSYMVDADDLAFSTRSSISLLFNYPATSSCLEELTYSLPDVDSSMHGYRSSICWLYMIN